MRDYTKFYIDGAWVEPSHAKTLDVINPATERSAGRISLGDASDVDRAVTAARRAFDEFSRTSREERLALLGRIVDVYKRRYNDMAEAITEEMGAPVSLAKNSQAAIGLAHFQTAQAILKNYVFEELRGSTLIAHEPIGVCGFITPWNWPMNQMACKVAPALAVGCTMVLKPSEVAPFSGQILAEILHEAGVPAGVFNLVNGDGPGVGAALSAHPEIDLVSFTGSTRAGIEVAKAAAPTVKRVHQELGGKSPNIILADADLKSAVTRGVKHVMQNSGQSCNAPTRMIAPFAQMDQVVEIARVAAENTTVGDPKGNAELGPVVSEVQWNKIQGLIAKGIEEGAKLVAGGTGRPEGLETGYYVKPTVFRRGHQRHDDRPRGDFWAGAHHPRLRHSRAGDRNRQRHALWPSRLRSGDRSGQNTRSGVAAAGGAGDDQWRRHGHHGAVRRLQAVGQWARVGGSGFRRVPGDQGPDRIWSRGRRMRKRVRGLCPRSQNWETIPTPMCEIHHNATWSCAHSASGAEVSSFAWYVSV